MYEKYCFVCNVDIKGIPACEFKIGIGVLYTCRKCDKNASQDICEICNKSYAIEGNGMTFCNKCLSIEVLKVSGEVDYVPVI